MFLQRSLDLLQTILIQAIAKEQVREKVVRLIGFGRMRCCGYDRPQVLYCLRDLVGRGFHCGFVEFWCRGMLHRVPQRENMIAAVCLVQRAEFLTTNERTRCT